MFSNTRIQYNTHIMKIYLASKSPRRKELLTQMGVEFETLPLDIAEEVKDDETPYEYSQRITSDKLIAAWQEITANNLLQHPVLCADTEVVIDNNVLGKAANYQDAFAMLKQHSGRNHEVITTVGLKYHNYMKIETTITIVEFTNIPDDAIHKYLKMGDYKDKSGSYGIQSYIGQFIRKINGCFYSVMGLPLSTVRDLLADLEKALKHD